MAVFDFDRTLIDFSSLHPFLRRLTSRAALGRHAVTAGVTTFPRWTRARIKARYVGSVLRDRSSREVEEIGARFAQHLSAGHLDTDMVRKLDEHRGAGDRTMVLSASLDLYLRPFVQDLGIDELLCTEVVAEHDVCTGELLNVALHGRGKVDALRSWLDDRGMQGARVAAYGNSWQDRALLHFARQTEHRR